jgi:hypothetical protein
MATRYTTPNITDTEAYLLDNTNDDFVKQGYTDTKCPRCGSTIVLEDYDASYVIGCEHGCVTLAYRGI